MESIPRNDGDFHVAQEKIVSTTALKLAAWGINEDWFHNTVEPLRTEWLSRWEA